MGHYDMVQMRNLVKSDVNLEDMVQPLVDGFNVPNLRNACKVLFVNGDVLTLSAELEQIGIVALHGSEAGNIDSADLVISESQNQLLKIVQQVLPQLFEGFLEPIIQAGVSVASIQDEEEKKSILTAKIVETVKDQEKTKQFGKTLMPYLGGAIKPVAQLVIASLYRFYYDRHKAQRQAIAEFNDIIGSLRRCGLLSPFLSLAFCQVCDNYELAFSRLTKFNPSCPKCGASWPVLTVNEFSQSFAALKSKNKDLPVFISAYLRSKSMLPIDVFPNAKFNLKSRRIEIDVFIPATAMGIECKCYANNVAVTHGTIKSEAGKIRKQIENYLTLGVKRVTIITNYNDIDAEKLRVMLKEAFKDVKGLAECKVLNSDMTAFAKFLDDESNKISDAMNTRFQNKLEHRVKKQLAEHTGREST